MAEKQLIYAVDDEGGIRDLYTCALESAGFAVVCFENGEGLFRALSERLPHLILLDIMLDGMDGYAILERIRRDAGTRNLPVIMVSAKGEEVSKVKGLNMGADDYLSKPFGVMELVARIHANLRRNAPAQPSLTYRDLEIDEKKHEVRVRGEAVTLTRKEYELLKILLVNAPGIVPRGDILSSVWGGDYFGETRTLDIHIATLRKHIAASEAKITTVRGVGYLLK